MDPGRWNLTIASLIRRGRPTLIFVLLIGIGCLVVGLLDTLTPDQPVPGALIRSVFQGAEIYEETDKPFHHHRALDADGNLLGAVIITDSLSPVVKGYLGEIGSAVGVTVDGRTTTVVPVRHRETPYYMAMVNTSGLWEQLAGLDLKKPFPVIDTVSGATVSSRAIIQDVRQASSLAARSLFDVDVPPPAGQMKNPWAGWQSILLACLLVLSLTAGFYREHKLLRETVTIANLIGIGFILNTPLTISALSRVITLNLPGPENALLVLILIYILVSLPLQGRSYCRLVCPFGTLQQLVNRMSPWQWSFSSKTAGCLPDIRRLVLGFLLFLAVWLGWSGFSEVEPFFSLFSLTLSPILWAMVIFILLMSVFIRRFWCNTMCPTGTLLSMISRLVRPGKGRADETV